MRFMDETEKNSYTQQTQAEIATKRMRKILSSNRPNHDPFSF